MLLVAARLMLGSFCGDDKVRLVFVVDLVAGGMRDQRLAVFKFGLHAVLSVLGGLPSLSRN